MGSNTCCGTDTATVLSQLLALVSKLTTQSALGEDGSFEYPICDNGVTKFVHICTKGCGVSSVSYYSVDRNTTEAPQNWSLVSAGACGAGAPTAGTAVAAFLEITDASSVAAGKQFARFRNVGISEATVLGTTLRVGEEITFTAYLDPVTSVFKRLPALAYDSSSTVLHITTID